MNATIENAWNLDLHNKKIALAFSLSFSRDVDGPYENYSEKQLYLHHYKLLGVWEELINS